jgi:type I restriction enzyme, R subunit
MKFTEEKLEQVFIELLGQQGIPHVHGSAISRNPDEVLIESDLKTFLQSQYENEQLTKNESSQIIRQCV